jgi:cellulose synthase/poly-beta-1,6-N-acetylglucosamine synthase-like glycosyltransferase
MLMAAIVIAFHAFQWVALLFFVVVNGGYIPLNVLTFLTLPRYLRTRVLADLPQQHTDLDPPVSLILTAFNEEAVIVDSVRSLLQLDYPEFEIIVVNDGSKDATLDLLIREFALVEFPEAFRPRVRHKPVRRIYQSRTYPELRVVDKENGGRKSDASNAGLNAARFPLVCPLDADSVLQRDSIRRLVRPFLENPHTVAVGGIVRLLNGCEVSGGYIRSVGLPSSPMALIQIVEYLRAFLFGRIGWAAIDALPLISGAFGLFHKETIIALGGYDHETLAEDMELVLRLHSHFRLQGKPYSVTFVPDPVCWTEAPEDLKTLRNQRIRWHRGLLECMSIHRALLFNPKAGLLGMLTMPFLLFCEGVGPLIEVAGYAIMIIGFAFGLIEWSGFLAFMAVALGLGIVLTMTSLLLEVIVYDTYPRLRQILALMLAAVAENFGYRQLTAIWRVQGIWRWLCGSDASWGRMERSAAWHSQPQAKAQGPDGPGTRPEPAIPTRMAS